MSEAPSRKSSNVNFTGKSGQRYCFQAWPIETKFKPMGGGIYIITKRECLDRTFTTKASHRCLAIGQASDLAAPALGRTDFAKLVADGANCVCVYPVADEAQRAQIETDLIDGNAEWGGGLHYLFHAVVPAKAPGGGGPVTG
jgi:hypothetical protein